MAQVQPVARDTVQPPNADRPMTLILSVVRIMDLVLRMNIVVMGIYVWMGFVRGLDEIGKGKGKGKGEGKGEGEGIGRGGGVCYARLIVYCYLGISIPYLYFYSI